jgi:hypothetical protein
MERSGNTRQITLRFSPCSRLPRNYNRYCDVSHE